MPGDDFKMQPPARGRGVPARTWQAMLAAQRLVKNRAHDTEADLSVTFPSTGIIYVRNDSGGNRSRFDVLGLSAPLVLPSANLGEFQRRVTFSGVMPQAAHSGKFCVLQEALPSGFIGRALVDGVTIGRLTVSTGQDGFGCADVIAGNAGALQPVDTASGTQILWKESGTGTVNAIFRIGPTCIGSLPSSGSGGCACGVFPNHVFITASGFLGTLASPDPATGSFALFNSTHAVPMFGCSGSVTLPDPDNPGLVGGTIAVNLLTTVSGSTVIKVTFTDWAGRTVFYTAPEGATDCCGPWTPAVNPADSRPFPATVSASTDCTSSGSGSGGGSPSVANLGSGGSGTGNPSMTLGVYSLLVVVVGQDIATAPSAVTFNGLALTKVRDSATAPGCSIWTYYNGTAFSINGNVSVTTTAGGYGYVVFEVANLASNTSDVGASGSGSATAAAAGPTSATTATNEIGVAGACTERAGAFPANGSWASPFTLFPLAASSFTVGGNDYVVRAACASLPSTGTVTATYTASPEPDTWSAVVETFK